MAQTPSSWVRRTLLSLAAITVVATLVGLVVVPHKRSGGPAAYDPLEATHIPHASKNSVEIEENGPTDHWAVKLADGVDPAEFVKEHGLEDLGPIGELKGYRLVGLPNHAHVGRDLHTVMEAREAQLRADAMGKKQIAWMERQVRQRRVKRIDPSDPLFSDQWHLKNTGQRGGTAGIDVNCVGAWEKDPPITGRGIRIAVVDDGVEYTHPDLATAYDSEYSYDINYNDANPAPGYGDDHGTCCAGAATARSDNNCGVGSAYEARLSAIRLISRGTTDADEASGLSFKIQDNHIYTNSWGPTDDGRRLEAPGPLTRMTMEDAITRGRDGKGSIYLWAGGNGRTSRDRADYDGYANSRLTIAVAAIGNDGKQSYYSEPGSCILMSCPSSGHTAGITTTDRVGHTGYDSGSCTNRFGGTSAAAPICAGVAALVLQANPQVTWRDLQHVFIMTAVLTDAHSSEWSTNGAGLHVSHMYGFGLVDATAAVEMVQSATWTPLPPALAPHTIHKQDNKAIPDNSLVGVSSTAIVTDVFTVEHVEIVLHVEHQRRGDLGIQLRSPSGTPSVFMRPHNDYSTGIDGWTFVSVRCWGERSQGEWTLQITDESPSKTGTLVSWDLVVYGHTNQE